MSMSWASFGDNHIHFSMDTHDGPAALDLPSFTLSKEREMTTTDELVYTDEWSGDSGAVADALYDSKTKTFYVTLTGGSSYAYDNVPEGVWTAFKNTYSKGRYYALNIKRTFGPGRYLGYEALEDAEKRSYEAPDFGNVTSTAVGTPKDLKYSQNATVTNVSQTFNLQAPLLEKTLSHTVRFNVEGDEAVKSYTLKAKDVTEAVAEVNGIGDALGLEFKVKEVTVHFE